MHVAFWLAIYAKMGSNHLQFHAKMLYNIVDITKQFFGSLWNDFFEILHLTTTWGENIIELKAVKIAVCFYTVLMHAKLIVISSKAIFVNFSIIFNWLQYYMNYILQVYIPY